MGNCLFNVNRRERNGGSVWPATGAAATGQTAGQTNHCMQLGETEDCTIDCSAGRNQLQTRDNQERLRVASWNVNGLQAGQGDRLAIICKTIIWENK